MFFKVSERIMHRVRWFLLASWLLLTLSLLYDPLSPLLTQANHSWSPLTIDPTLCVEVQGQCFAMEPYSVGPAIFWGIILPVAILSFITFGHELWRRICPLSFVSQLPNRLGLQRQVRQFNRITERVSYATPKIKPESWLGKNHTYLQFGLLFLGLCGRIVFFNATRPLLAGLFLVTMGAAISVGYLFAGKSWCQYFCPMAPVQQIYMQPAAIFSSQANVTPVGPTQSMCREVSAQEVDEGACVGCKKSCIDIDGERAYWATLKKPQQSFLHYAYLGLVCGYFAYYYLYSGNWNYYLSGVWAQDNHQLETVFDTGFYLFGQGINIPKLLAAPLTLGVFTAIGVALGHQLEKNYHQWMFLVTGTENIEQIRHQLFSIVTFVVFHIYFAFGGRPFLQLLPVWLQYSYQVAIILLSLLWLKRVWGRSSARYKAEGKAVKKRKTGQGKHASVLSVKE